MDILLLKLIVLLCGLFLMVFLDLKNNRISNNLILIMLCIFLGIASFEGGKSMMMALFGMLLGGVLFLIPYYFGQVGGADVKVFAVVGSCLSIGQIIDAYIYTLIAGMFLITLFKFFGYERRNLAVCRELQSCQESVLYKKNSVPYLPAITIGVILSIQLPLEWML